MNATARIAVLLMAAGGSGRSGTPKLLLEFEGQSLLRRAAEAATLSQASSTIAVLGSDAPRLEAELKALPVRTIVNSRWKEGLSTSIRCGIESVSQEADGALIMLADQPLISPEILNKLIQAFRTGGHPIVASAYGQTMGVPAVFAASVFPDLLNLNADRGAKDVILKNRRSVLTVPVPEAAVDIDTPEDLKKLQQRFSPRSRQQ